MRLLCKKICASLTGALCAVTLLFPARVAHAIETPQTDARAEAVAVAPDNDALFYGYLLQRAGVSNRASLMADAASQLGARDRELYDQLRAFVSKVASGDETQAVITVVCNDYPRTWTAVDLGVTDILSPQGDEAMLEKLQAYYNVPLVFAALLADCPYELYWYNKDENSDGGVEFAFSLPYSANSAQATLSSPPTITFAMRVAQDYGEGTTVDRSLHKGIDNVVSAAASIVDAYKGQPDYQKLLGYSTEICKLVEYDEAAADENTHTPYGDPWQLISVFDGDENTNVVCEGYAKAFKYLCDLSTFDSSAIECHLVTGLLAGGTGQGEHMWNIVTMDNGKRYLVDVTNSDSNGGPDYLFLKGGTPHPQSSAQYTFYDWITFVYDYESLDLWGDEFLTLDTADYEYTAPEPGTNPESGYTYQILDVAPDGTGVTVEIANLSGGGAVLTVAAYAENGQFLRAVVDGTRGANITGGTSGRVTVQLDTTGAKTVRAILMDSSTYAPLCPFGEYTAG